MILPSFGTPRPGESYRRTQIGGTMIVAVLAVLLVTGFVVLNTGGLPAVVIVAIVCVGVVALLGSLTVVVTDSEVTITFGVGVIRKHFALDAIRSCRVVRNAWYHGTGIRMINGGWLYNVAGRMAVELERTDGSIVRIGSGEPAELLEAIQRAAKLADHGRASDALTDSGGYWPALIVVPVVIALGVMFYMEMRAPRVVITAESLSVRSGFYKSTIPIRSISEVIVSDSLPRITARTNGFALGSTRRGHFRVDSMGRGMLFLDRGYPPYVVVRTDSSFVIIGFKDYTHTRALIEALAKASAP